MVPPADVPFDPMASRPTNPADPGSPQVEVFVDPSCPFAWITEQWLAEVERVLPIGLRVRLLSLSVVNEGREIDAWYRTFNDAAWAPARVMAAVERDHGPSAARCFYEAFGRCFHVESGTEDDVDRVAVVVTALERAGLPAALALAATDSQLDEVLRDRTQAALSRVGLDVGVPVTVIDGVASSGPVLGRIPRGDDAVHLFDALVAIAQQPAFVRLERSRTGSLDVH